MMKWSMADGVFVAITEAGASRSIGRSYFVSAPVVREHAGIPDDQVIMICVAMGYPDESFPANAVISRRRAVKDVASFVGFN